MVNLYKLAEQSTNWSVISIERKLKTIYTKHINKAKQRIVYNTKLSISKVNIFRKVGFDDNRHIWIKNLQKLAKSETVDEFSLKPATIVTQFSICQGKREIVAERSASFASLYEWTVAWKSLGPQYLVLEVPLNNFLPIWVSTLTCTL